MKLMKKVFVVFVTIMMTTVVLDKGECKVTVIDRIEKQLDKYIMPDYELEIVNEYKLAMGGFLC